MKMKIQDIKICRMQLKEFLKGKSQQLMLMFEKKEIRKESRRGRAKYTQTKKKKGKDKSKKRNQ